MNTNYLAKTLVTEYCPKQQRLNLKEYCYSYGCYLKTATTLKKVLDNNAFTDESYERFNKNLSKMLKKSKTRKRYDTRIYHTFEDELFDKLADHSLNKSQLKKLNRKLKVIMFQHNLTASFETHINPTID